MKLSLKTLSNSPKVFKVFCGYFTDRIEPEFIGYLSEMTNGKWLFNPHNDLTLKSKEFDSFEDAKGWLIWSDY